MRPRGAGGGVGVGVVLLVAFAGCGGGTGVGAGGGGRLVAAGAAVVAPGPQAARPAVGPAEPAPPAPLLDPVVMAAPPVAAAARAVAAPPDRLAPPAVRAPAPPAPAVPGAGDGAGVVSAAATGTVEGRVSRGGQPVAGARVALVAADGAERTAATDGDGGYRFAAVPPGPYRLVVSTDSGETCDDLGCISARWMERADLTVAAGATSRLDVGD